MRTLILPALLVCSLFAHAQNLPSYLPTAGLVGWWPFSGNAFDSSMHGNNGVVTNATLTTDRFGTANAAYYFNGANSRIDIADAASLRCRKITMSAWVLNNNISAIGQIIYKGSPSAEGEAYSLSCVNQVANTGFKLNSQCTPGVGWQGITSKAPMLQGTWEHYVMTYNGLLLKLFRNGQLDTTITITGLIDSCLNGGLRFGFNHLRFPSSTGHPFNGLIDDIGIWNRALSTTEITNLFEAGQYECGKGNVGVNICEPKRSLHVKDVLRLEPRSFPPSQPEKGDMYFDGTLNKLRVYDGTSWKECW